MFIDKNLEFSDSQALTATAVSQNVIDLGADEDIGPGEDLFAVVVVEVAPDHTTGDETYVATVQTGSTATPTDLIGSIVIPRTAKKGDVFFMPIASHNDRYLRMNFTLGGTTPTITVSAFLTVEEPSSWRATPDAI